MTIAPRFLSFCIFLLCSFATVCGQTVGGIGAVLKLDTLKDGHTFPLIQSVVPGSPAAQTLKAGLHILSIDGTDCIDLSLEQVVTRIRGEAGTKVNLAADDDAHVKHAKVYELTRATIQQPTTYADPIEAFNAGGEQEVKRLRHEGHSIINTYRSDCGNYFFNFNADKGTYIVRMLTLEGQRGAANSIHAKVLDGDNESTAVSISNVPGVGVDYSIQEGKISFGRETVGTIALQLAPSSASNCKAIFIIVYQ